MYKVGLRMLRKRDEHHRLQNDSVKGAKAEGLWGQGLGRLSSVSPPQEVQILGNLARVLLGPS